MSFKNSRKKRCLPAIIASAENGGKGTSFFGKYRAFVETFHETSLQAFFKFSAFNFQIICIFAPLNFLE